MRFSPESIQRVVAQTIFRAFPIVTRTCSVWTVMMMAGGWTRTTTILTTSGIVTTGSRSSRRNSLYFSSGLPGEFCFWSCPFHPPSIRLAACPKNIGGVLIVKMFQDNAKNTTPIKKAGILWVVSDSTDVIAAQPGQWGHRFDFQFDPPANLSERHWRYKGCP